MAQNPYGYVVLFDGGNPRIVTGEAREAISGGQFVFCSGAEDVVASGADSYVMNDIKLALTASGAEFNGIALANTASGAPCAFATKGTFIVACGGSVLAGRKVGTPGGHAVETLGSTVIPAALYDAGMAGREIGRALTAGASGNYAVVDISA